MELVLTVLNNILNNRKKNIFWIGRENSTVMSIPIPGKCFLSNTHLCVVPWPSFVRVRTPLLVFGPRSSRKERYIILCVASAIFVTAPIAGSPGWVEIQSHFYRAIRCCMFLATKMEHVNRFGIQKTENLEEKKVNGITVWLVFVVDITRALIG